MELDILKGYRWPSFPPFHSHFGELFFPWHQYQFFFVNRSVSPAGVARLSVSTSPIRPVRSPILVRKTQAAAAMGAEVLPPWKQEGYVATSETRMKDTRVTTSTTQMRTEERWEGRYGVHEQVAISGAATAEATLAIGAAAAAAATEVRPFQRKIPCKG